MPAIGNLRRLRQRLGGGQRISAAAVTRDNDDLGLSGQPRLRGRRLPVGQKADRPSSFEIANDRAVTLVALPRPIVDSDHSRRRDYWAASPANGSQQGVVAHRQHQSTSEAGGRAAAEGKSEMMDEAV